MKQTKQVSIPLWQKIVPPCLLAVLTAVVYWPSLHYAFQFDDIANITKFFHIRHNSLSALFFSGTRWISYWLNAMHYGIGKFDPYSYRVGNVIIHTTNGMLVFFVLLLGLSRLRKESLGKRRVFALAFMTSLLFLLHPVQTQTVSYVIQGQLEGLAMMGILSMTLLLLLWAPAQHTISKGIYLGLLFVVSILVCGTKEIAIVSPLLLILVDWFFIAEGVWQEFKQRIGLHATLSGVVWLEYLYLLKPHLFLNILMLNSQVKNNIGNVITHNPKDIVTPLVYFISQFKVVLHYLWMFIWPFGISVEYDWMLSSHLLAPDCLFPLLVLSLLGYILYRIVRANNASLFGFGALWFAVSIAPRSSIVPSPELLVDYKTYVASFGWLLVLAIGLIALVEWLGNAFSALALLRDWRAHTGLALMSACMLSAATFNRNHVWSSGLAFWGNVIANAPGKARAYNNYGVELSQTQQKYAEAIPYFQKAISMDKAYADPCNNLAVACAQLNRIDDAIAALKRGLRINPYYPEGYNNIASFFLKKKEYEFAQKALKTALKLRPHYGKAYYNLGRVYLEQDKQEQAWECFKNCCTKADLDNAAGYLVYAQASLTLKKFDHAVIGYKKVLECEPANTDARFNLGNAHFYSKQYEQAIAQYKRVLAARPQDTRAQFNIGEAYFMMDKPREAKAQFEKMWPLRTTMPQLYIRLAGCHQKLGDIAKSRQLLTQVEGLKAPENVKTRARILLAEVDKQTKIVTA